MKYTGDSLQHQNTATSGGSLALLWARHQRLLPVAGLGVVIALAAAAWMLRGVINALPVAGYPGVFLLNFIGAVSIVLPVPGLISTCGLSVALNPFVLACLAGIGESLGECSGYVIGYGGDTLFDRVPMYRRVRPFVARWMRRRGMLLLLLASAIPNPLFDLVGIAAGTAKYPFRRFMIVVFCGKMFKALMVAYTCHYGITALPWVS